MPDCIFCKIVSGEVQALKVYEDDFVVAFLDINPGTRGQVVLTTKKHVSGIHELSPSETGKVFQAVRLIIIGMTQSLNCEGVNVIYSLGAAAGQRSDHMIIYILPRYKEDRVIIQWEPQRGDINDLRNVSATLIKAIKEIPQIISSPKPKVITEPEEKEEIIEEKPKVPIY